MNDTNMQECVVRRVDETPETNQSTRGVYRPSVDIRETENDYRLDLDLPGARRDSIDVRFEDGVLSVEANVEDRGLGEGAAWRRREYGVGSFRRSFRLGEDIDPNAIDARYADGVLSLTLPKSEAARPVQIAVQGG